MNGLGAAFAGRLDDPIDAKIAFGGRSRTDRVRIIGVRDMQGLAVRIGVNRDRFNIQLEAGADDANRDLAPISDEDTFKHLRTPYSPPPTSGVRGKANQSGIFPCFLGGLFSRLFFSISRERINIGRVSSGEITASM